jgi:S1-C subfamily serine protease
MAFSAVADARKFVGASVSPIQAKAFDVAKRAVVRVGDGRGFVVSAGEYNRYVVTAAHCISKHPKPHLANDANELTRAIIGPLGRKKPTISAALCADNLIDDVAVFSEPDGQVLWDECQSYEKFTAAAALVIGKPPVAVEPHNWRTTTGMAAWVLSLDRKWQPCLVQNGGRFLCIKEASIEGGMSGSPIIDANGAAIGLISTGNGGDDYGYSVNPSLMDCLPPWLLRKLDTASASP